METKLIHQGIAAAEALSHTVDGLAGFGRRTFAAYMLAMGVRPSVSKALLLALIDAGYVGRLRVGAVERNFTVTGAGLRFLGGR